MTKRHATSAAAAVLLTALLLSGCATTGAHGERSLILIDTQTEVQMGLESDRGIRQEYPVLDDASIQEYVNTVGARCAENSERQDIRYTFTVLDSEILNAFAAPGGYIYVTSGLLAAADDEAELAGVLSHEIGHVIGRHSVRAMQNALGVQVIAEILLGDREGGGWGQVAGAGAGLFMLRNSRENEFQADQFGVKLAVVSGYDPEGVLRFFEKLLAETGGGPEGFAGWLSTHPATQDRIERAREEIALYDLTGHPRERNRDQYRRITASLR